ncbi:hypothetical protein COLO4_09797 [Corchorus olitorius]|uniref:HMA domain-containing protein n=1 Tax=Corchorus olitorius TaxID=93759 RepID=A0A1R3KB73_9ROSI|nr:hypothetical protein COLO4_09797 [Corchorus olitorius]
MIKMSIPCDKCRRKAMKTVSHPKKGTVESVAAEGAGDEKLKVVVIVDGVDAYDLTKKLRKKLPKTKVTLEIVEEIKVEEKKPPAKVEEKKPPAKVEEKKPPAAAAAPPPQPQPKPSDQPQQLGIYYPYPYYPETYQNSCAIL